MLGFIGAGNMASAIIKGLCLSERFKDSITVFDISKEKVLSLKNDYGVIPSASAVEVCERSDVIVLAVKPNVLEKVIGEIRETVKRKNPLIISIAAGKTVDFLSKAFSFDGRIVRVMPNINAVSLSAVSAFCLSKNALEGDKKIAREFCESFGEAFEVPENLFSVYSAVASCAPAFTYMYIDALKTAAVKNGMSASLALEIAASQVVGSGKMVLSSKEHPISLVDKVCSPGGTTIEGVSTLKKNAFDSAIIEAIDACCEKDKLL